MPFAPETNQLICRFFGHRRSQRVWHEGDGYRAQCKRCSADLFKQRGASDWRTAPDGND
jgi:hypothetical protein